MMLGLLVLGLAACEQPRAHGDAHAIIVGTSPELWEQVEDVVHEALEPTILTVREEGSFRVTWQDPTVGADWGNLRRFRQVLVIGSERDPWVAEALERRDRTEPLSPPQVLQVQNVWARGQQVSIILTPEEDRAEAVRETAGRLHDLLDQQYRAFVRNRMFVSGRDTVLADSLRTHVGFSLVLPNVYRHSVRDSVYRFRNDNPSPSELIREIGATWWTPMPEEDPTAEELAEWRSSFAEAYYNDPQLLDEALFSAYHEVEVNGAAGVEFQSAWVSPPDAWPAGGAFITRAVRCPDQDRMYLLDAWLYAPGRDKYEYMIQLETILDSFRCG
jgi:hypothetical protein